VRSSNIRLQALRPRQVAAVAIAAQTVLVLAACGGTSPRLPINVVSNDQEPVTNAEVRVVGGSKAPTNLLGRAVLTVARPGRYRVSVSAPGFFTKTATLQTTTRKPPTVQLDFRPAPGTYVWNIGPNNEYWDQATVTKTAITSTEYDWMCHRNSAGNLVGGWFTFAGQTPAATAPNTIDSFWVRRHFPPTGPPRPPSGCRVPGSAGTPIRKQLVDGHTPWWVT
jgi:hypothetical protein